MCRNAVDMILAILSNWNQLFSHRKNLYKASKVHLVPGRYFQYLSIDNPHEFRL